MRELDFETGADGRRRSLYSLRHTYATFALRDGRDIHKLALQMGTSVEMLKQFYSKLSPRMNAAEHAGIRSKQGWTVQLELDCSLLSISLNKHLNTLKNIKNNWKKSSQTLDDDWSEKCFVCQTFDEPAATLYNITIYVG